MNDTIIIIQQIFFFLILHNKIIYESPQPPFLQISGGRGEKGGEGGREGGERERERGGRGREGGYNAEMKWG